MILETIHSFFLWRTLINVGILMVWFLTFVFAHDWIRNFHGKWFHLSRDQFDAIHYAGIAIFKIGIWLLNLAPLLALSIMK